MARFPNSRADEAGKVSDTDAALYLVVPERLPKPQALQKKVLSVFLDLDGKHISFVHGWTVARAANSACGVFTPPKLPALHFRSFLTGKPPRLLRTFAACSSGFISIAWQVMEMFPILLLDDAEGDLILAERLLRNCKIMNPILTFRKGEELLAYFAGEFDPPALILTDMMMEPMSGVDVLAALQRRGLTDTIPVVMVSGLADHKVLQNGYQRGARTFIIKPMDQNDILQILGKVKGLEIHEIDDGYVIARNTVGGSDLKTLKFGM